MEKHLHYTPIDYLVGVFRMAHIGALFIILFLSIGGGVSLWISGLGWFPMVCFSLAGLLLTAQIISRCRYLTAIRSLRFRKGELEVRHPQSGEWVTGSQAMVFTAGFFPFADPWRPFTEGFPGIEIALEDCDDPAYDLFGYGMDKKRDEVFECLKQMMPNKTHTL